MNPAENICITFNPFDAMALCVEKIREKNIQHDGNVIKQIDIIPEQIGVVGSNNWQKKDTSSIKDYKAIEKKMDWTYSTPYKGNIQVLSDGDLLN